MKQLELWTNVPELDMYLQRNKHHARQRLDEAAAHVEPLTFKQMKSSSAKASASSSSSGFRSDVWITGNSGTMEQSKEYPQEFADCIAKVIAQTFEHAQPSKRKSNPKLKGLS